MLTHFSYSRLKFQEENLKKWELEEIFNELKKVWGEFYLALPEEKKDWFGCPPPPPLP